jgi:hypothetical protein
MCMHLRLTALYKTRLVLGQEVDLGKSVKATQTDAAPQYKTIAARTPGVLEEDHPAEHLGDEFEEEEDSGECSEAEASAGEVMTCTCAEMRTGGAASR